MESPCGPQVSQMYSLQQVARVTCNTPQTVSFRLQSLGSVLISLSLCIQAATSCAVFTQVVRVTYSIHQIVSFTTATALDTSRSCSGHCGCFIVSGLSF